VAPGDALAGVGDCRFTLGVEELVPGCGADVVADGDDTGVAALSTPTAPPTPAERLKTADKTATLVTPIPLRCRETPEERTFP